MHVPIKAMRSVVPSNIVLLPNLVHWRRENLILHSSVTTLNLKVKAAQPTFLKYGNKLSQSHPSFPRPSQPS